MKQNNCITIKKRKFLGWKWEEEIIKHIWAYKNKEERVCQSCGRREMLFGYDYFEGFEREDWRLKV